MRKCKLKATEGIVCIVPPSTTETRITVGVCDIGGRNVTLGLDTPPEVVQKIVGANVTKLTRDYKPYIPKAQRNAEKDSGDIETG